MYLGRLLGWETVVLTFVNLVCVCVLCVVCCAGERGGVDVFASSRDLRSRLRYQVDRVSPCWYTYRVLKMWSKGLGCWTVRGTVLIIKGSANALVSAVCVPAPVKLYL